MTRVVPMKEPTELHWFVAVLVLESSIEEGWSDSDSSIDIQYRLIRAASAEDAYERALTLGRQAEHSYENPYGQICVWSFMGLKDLQEVVEDELTDGVEVYGFIDDGTALHHVVPKELLTVFRENVPPEDDPDFAPWGGVP